ncbi:all trans-polyprenyl-diphosphate synthase PDSS2-like [Dendroctonus ponderosae]|uniref:all trans-polyprenyl-diphosphate synthase PDSS2-like n=1 Tax=Dendroctonus ponderosae TaxID=77166 RepID=UPI002034F6B2|nr:all trans-polyprenyl-diphosphate synthase PDSS2-like [Dendroctonus ponderosae]
MNNRDKLKWFTGILHSQRVLAEVTEMIRTSNILHNSVLNINTNDVEEYSDLNFGNTLSLLTGIFSFATNKNRPLPAKPLEESSEIIIPNEFGTAPLKVKEVLGNAKAEWTLRHFLGSGSLLAKSCQAALKLANHPEEFQKLGYLFGRNMALGWQAYFDLECFEEGCKKPFDLISAPILFHLQHDPDFYAEILKGSEDVRNCDYDRIRELVQSGPGLEMTRQLKQNFVKNCFDILDEFRATDAKRALVNILKVL